MSDSVTTRQLSSTSPLPIFMYNEDLQYLVDDRKKDSTSSKIISRISRETFPYIWNLNVEEEETDTETNMGEFSGYGYSQPLTMALKLKLESRIGEICQLKDGWDGSKALAIKHDTRQFAMTLLDIAFGLLTNHTSYLTKFEIFPSSSGGFQFEIRYGYKEIEIEYQPDLPFYLVLFIDIEGEKEFYQEKSVKHKDLPLLLDWLFKQDV